MRERCGQNIHAAIPGTASVMQNVWWHHEMFCPKTLPTDFKLQNSCFVLMMMLLLLLLVFSKFVFVRCKVSA